MPESRQTPKPETPQEDDKALALDRGDDKNKAPRKSTGVVLEKSSWDDPTPVRAQVQESWPYMINYRFRKLVNQMTFKIANSNRYFLKLEPTFYPSGMLATGAGTLIIHDGGAASPSVLTLYTIPKNSLSLNDSNTDGSGNILRIFACGFYSTDDAGATVAIALKIGTTTYHTITSVGAVVTNVPWFIDWRIAITALGSAGTCETFCHAEMNYTNRDSPGTAAVTLASTSDQAISLTSTWAGGSGNDIFRLRQFHVELLN